MTHTKTPDEIRLDLAHCIDLILDVEARLQTLYLAKMDMENSLRLDRAINVPMTTQQFFDSIVGLTIEQATMLLHRDPKGSTVIEDESKIFKLGKKRGRIRVATQRDRRENVWKIVKVYGRG